MNQFSDFGIKSEIKSFTGDKIAIERMVNRDIIVHDFKIVDSIKNAGKCLHLQIEVNNEMRVIFTGSGPLMEVIQKVPKDSFPFKAQIIKENRHFEFK